MSVPDLLVRSEALPPSAGRGYLSFALRSNPGCRGASRRAIPAVCKDRILLVVATLAAHRGRIQGHIVDGEIMLVTLRLQDAKMLGIEGNHVYDHLRGQSRGNYHCLRCVMNDRASRRHMKVTRFLFAFHLESEGESSYRASSRKESLASSALAKRDPHTISYHTTDDSKIR
jgi:hypothetical protein